MERAGHAHLGSLIIRLTGTTGLFLSCYYIYMCYLEGRKTGYFYCRPVCSCRTRMKFSGSRASATRIVIMHGDKGGDN